MMMIVVAMKMMMMVRIRENNRERIDDGEEEKRIRNFGGNLRTQDKQSKSDVDVRPRRSITIFSLGFAFSSVDHNKTHSLTSLNSFYQK